MNEKPTANIKRLSAILLRYLTLQLDYARLSAAEKLTVLLSTIAFFALLVILGMITLVFISIGIGHWLLIRPISLSARSIFFCWHS